MLNKNVRYTVFQGRAGDRNSLGIAGAQAIGNVFLQRSGTPPVIVGAPAAALDAGWREELDAALPGLHRLKAHMEGVFAEGALSVAATSRCAASLATLPALAKYYPQACVVWFDAHGDLNTPGTTTSGFLGGLALTAPLGLWQSGLGSGLAFSQLVLVGQRDLDPDEELLIEQHNIPCIRPGQHLAERLREAVAGRAVYAHVDCDVLEPGIVPTDYISKGGLLLQDLHACFQTFSAETLLGMEIAEFESAWQAGGPPAAPEPLVDALLASLYA